MSLALGSAVVIKRTPSVDLETTDRCSGPYHKGIGFSVAYASAVSPSAHAAQSEEFGISADVSALSTALFLFAFGIGKLFSLGGH